MKNNYSFIAAADIHLGLKLYNLPELEEDMMDAFVRLCDMAVAKHVDYLVIVGDLFEDNEPRPDIVAFVKKQTDRLAALGIQVLGLAGDHDKPINGSAWYQVAGIKSLWSVPLFAGTDYFDYSTASWWDAVVKNSHKDAEWLFLHGQLCTMYKFTEDKKKLDFTDIPLFQHFTKLKGVILGDIHAPMDGELVDEDKSVFIGYCSSTGVNDYTEFSQEKRILYFDGTELIKCPFVPRRDYVKINFTGDVAKDFSTASYTEKYKDAEFKPVFLVELDPESERAYKDRLLPLYDLGIVRKSDKTVKKKAVALSEDTEEVVSIRSELATSDRITETLKACCEKMAVGDKGYKLTAALLSDADPTIALDKFRKESGI